MVATFSTLFSSVIINSVLSTVLCTSGCHSQTSQPCPWWDLLIYLLLSYLRQVASCQQSTWCASLYPTSHAMIQRNSLHLQPTQNHKKTHKNCISSSHLLLFPTWHHHHLSNIETNAKLTIKNDTFHSPPFIDYPYQQLEWPRVQKRLSFLLLFLFHGPTKGNARLWRNLVGATESKFFTLENKEKLSRSRWQSSLSQSEQHTYALTGSCVGIFFLPHFCAE